MFKRDWDGTGAPLIIVVIGLLVIALIGWNYFYSKGYQSADQRHHADDVYRQAAEKYYKDCLANNSVKVALDCYRSAAKADRDEQRAEQDLDAQREMADWAEGMLWATLVIGGLSLLVGGTGVVYVAMTLREARETTKAAVAASDAATDTNRIMRDEQRPWLSIDVRPTMGIKCIPSGLAFGFEVVVLNIGRTPAKDVHVEVSIHQEFGHNDEARFIELRDFIIERAETEFQRPDAILPNETARKSFARSVGIHDTIVSKAVGGFLPFILVAVIYKVPQDGEWRCTATAFAVYRRAEDGIGLGCPIRLDQGDMLADQVNILRSRHGITS